MPGVVVRHPAVLGLHAVCAAPDGRLLVTEMVAASPLAEVLSQRSLTPREALALTGRVAEALQAFHDQGACHGRLGPDWILVNGDLEPALCPCGVPSQSPEDRAADLRGLGRLLEGWLPPRSFAWRFDPLAPVYRACDAARDGAYQRPADFAADLARADHAGRVRWRERWVGALILVLLLLPWAIQPLRRLAAAAEDAPPGARAAALLPLALAFLCPTAVLAGYAQMRSLVQYLRLRRPGRDRILPGETAFRLAQAGAFAALAVALGAVAVLDAGTLPGAALPALLLVLTGFWAAGGVPRRHRHLRRTAGAEPATRVGPGAVYRPMKRRSAPLADGTFDLLVLGGGITGAGVALDAALRGFRGRPDRPGRLRLRHQQRLVETGPRRAALPGARRLSAWSTRRCTERRRLLTNAPHLVRPLPLRPALLRRDARTRRGSGAPACSSTTCSPAATTCAAATPCRRPACGASSPACAATGFSAGPIYYDAQMDDARLCVEVLKTADRAGACVANYVEATGFEKDGGRIAGVRARDHVGGGEFAIRARVVLNATGPWVDRVCRLAGDDGGPHLRPTKGVHLVTPDRELRAAFLLLHPDDGRVLFVIPWMGKTLIGTTDTDSDADPEALAVTPAEVDYLLRAHNHYLAPPLGAGDVLGSFAGLRPLAAVAAGRAVVAVARVSAVLVGVGPADRGGRQVHDLPPHGRGHHRRGG